MALEARLLFLQDITAGSGGATPKKMERSQTDAKVRREGEFSCRRRDYFCKWPADREYDGYWNQAGSPSRGLQREYEGDEKGISNMAYSG